MASTTTSTVDNVSVTRHRDGTFSIDGLTSVQVDDLYFALTAAGHADMDRVNEGAPTGRGITRQGERQYQLAHRIHAGAYPSTLARRIPRAVHVNDTSGVVTVTPCDC